MDFETFEKGESGWLSARNFQFARTMGGGLDENFLGSIRGVTLKNADSIGRIIGDNVIERRQDGNDNQRLGRQIPNSQSQVGTIQENLGRNYEQGGAEGIQQRRSSEVRNQRNNRRITPEQSERLKTTAIKDENGNPKEVSHFTDNMDFEAFEKGDIGFHFGSE